MKKNFIILFLILTIGILFYILIRPDSTEKTQISHEMIMEQVEELGQLELVKYTIQDIMEYKKLREWLPNSKTVLLISGEVVACIDLTKITKNDITIYDDSVSIHLPMPEICHFKIDHSRSRVYDVQFGLWDTSRLVDEAYESAEREIYNQALEMGIANDSYQSAIKLLTPILQALGFKKVNIEFKQHQYQSKTENREIKIIPTPKK